VDNIAYCSRRADASLILKPDVTAPGSVASAAPPGGFVEQRDQHVRRVAGAAALLPPASADLGAGADQVRARAYRRSVHNGGTAEVNPLREGGGRINLVRADQPLVFASPTNLSFGLLKPGATARRTVGLADAGGGAGVWKVTTSIAGAPLSLPAQATVPGSLPVRAVVPRNAREGRPAS
jgi:hypothetical protein